MMIIKVGVNQHISKEATIEYSLKEGFLNILNNEKAILFCFCSSKQKSHPLSSLKLSVLKSKLASYPSSSPIYLSVMNTKFELDHMKKVKATGSIMSRHW